MTDAPEFHALELESDAPESDAPVEDLTPGERLLLDGLRGWAASRAIDCCPHATAQRILGWRTSRRVAALFCAWMQSIESSVRRPIRAYCRHCRGVGPDERRLIQAVGLSVIELAAGESLLEPLSADPTGALVIARALNAALAEEGFPVPARLDVGRCVQSGPTFH
jgi:hypothetical protein